ncbi:hypothetical protein [Pseudomonas caspiana]|uniref:hypothetical protein n=1 Tax=Pseudomonas caspiana TaxID=1451454 RepID=UPI0032ED9888
MNNKKLTALMLAGMLTAGSAFAGSTGPTNPVDTAPKTPASGMEKNTDGTTTGTPGTSPGVKGMDPEPKIDGATGTGNGMSDDQNKGGGGKAGGSGGAGGSSSGG